VVSPVAAFRYEVIDVGLNVPTDLQLEYFSDHSGASLTGIFQTLRHSHETKVAKRSDEAGFFLVLFRHPALMVARKAIQERHDGRAGH
jgi:hypothetical protein